MKRNLSGVKRDHVRRLIVWLKAEDKMYCPFRDNGLSCEADICSDVFPFLPPGDCPCSKSGLKYTISVARLVIHKCQR